MIFCNRGKPEDRNHDYFAPFYGDNLLMPGLTAALIYGQKDVLPEFMDSKEENFKRYANSSTLSEIGWIPIPEISIYDRISFFIKDEQMLRFSEDGDALAGIRKLIYVLCRLGIECRPGFYPLKLLYRRMKQDFPCGDTIEDWNMISNSCRLLATQSVILPSPLGMTDEEFGFVESTMKELFLS
jgi:dTDP-4-amino-4,6-dideoxygalactose transaminase